MTKARVGKDQLRTLIMLGSPTMIMLTDGYRSEQGLLRRGLLRKASNDGGLVITAAGLRALADEMDAGRVAEALEAMKKDETERRAKVAAKEAADRAKRDAAAGEERGRVSDDERDAWGRK